MTTIGYINISLELFGGALSLILMVCMRLGEDRGSRLNTCFIRILLCNMALLASDAVAWGFKGNLAPYAFLLVRVANCLVFALPYVLMALFVDYTVTYIGTRGAVSRWIVPTVRGVCAVAVLLVLVNQFNGMYYIIDQNNIYQRQPLFWLSQAWGLLGMAAIAVLIVRHRHRLRRREKYLLLSYVIFPMAAMAVQMFVYGLALLYIATTLSVLAIYVGIQADQARLMKAQELALSESRTAIMLSQIQPHFLYNSLVVIKQLCELDPKLAAETVVEFSSYLRSNLDSLAIKRPIPFEKELEHVETYLSLEQKRFGDRFSVEWDIRARDFSIPALTLQPIVENAVRHGVSKLPQGGLVTIATRRAREGVTIKVRDNGAGFDPAVPKQDGRSHVGLENVRSRLASMCGGTLDIDSRLGGGTTVTLRLPEGGRKA